MQTLNRTSKKRSTGLSKGAQAGIGIGVAALVLLIAAAVWSKMRYRDDMEGFERVTDFNTAMKLAIDKLTPSVENIYNKGTFGVIIKGDKIYVNKTKNSVAVIQYDDDVKEINADHINNSKSANSSVMLFPKCHHLLFGNDDDVVVVSKRTSST